jgi:TatA/E family protein of Tat protein translocase
VLAAARAHFLDVEDRAMGEFSIWHWLIVLAVVLLLFGGGKLSGLMGELATGIKAFKRTMADNYPPAVAHARPQETAHRS